jgi:hypothetical protein
MPPSMMLQQHAVAGAIAKHEEVRIDAGIGNRAAPIAAIRFGGLDRRRNAPVRGDNSAW